MFEGMAIHSHDPISQPPLPYQKGVIVEAFKLALQGTTPDVLSALAKQNGRSLAYILLNLRKGSRQAPKRIGKRGWQWNLNETASAIKITGLERTPEAEVRAREKFGVRHGSEKP
jgi:hypothetical protein